MTYINKRFGRLVIKNVVKENSFDYFICKCDCGKTIKIRAFNVLSGSTQSCGCFRKEICKENAKKMGIANRKEMYCRICGKKHYARGLCKYHYERDRISGYRLYTCEENSY